MRAANHIPSIMRLAPLLVLLALILFPFGWLGQQSPAFGRGLDHVFSTDRRHAIGHAALFCLMGLATLIVLPSLHARPLRYLGMLVLVGIGQEFFQLLYKRRLLLFDDGRDLLTDLAGMIAAFVVVWIWRRSKALGDAMLRSHVSRTCSTDHHPTQYPLANKATASPNPSNENSVIARSTHGRSPQRASKINAGNSTHT